MHLLDLPAEIIIRILKHVFSPWSATISTTYRRIPQTGNVRTLDRYGGILSYQLSPIPNIQVLRTNNFFCTEGTNILMKLFTGEFVRHDKGGRLVDQNVEPKEWLRWIMQHTKVLHLQDTNPRLWYISGYWDYYPALETFRTTKLPGENYTDMVLGMPGFEEQRRSCDERHGRFAKADYKHHSWLFDEMLDTIYKDMERQGRKLWPTFEHCFRECRCHPARQTVFALRRIKVPKEVQDFIDESFTSSAHDVEGDSRKLLHKAIINCVTLLDEHGFPRRLGIINVSFEDHQ